MMLHLVPKKVGNQSTSTDNRVLLRKNKIKNTVSKYQLSLTNLCDMLHHSKRAANKGGRSV